MPCIDCDLEKQTTAERLASLELMLAKLTKAMLQAREPIRQTVFLSATRPWIMEYRNRKHVFLWIPSTTTILSFEDYGTGPVQPQVWTNLAMPAGTRVFAPNNASDTQVMLLFTDEVLP